MEELAVLDDAQAQRGHLMSVAFRMLGTVADAEDAVQETYIRWYRLPPEDRAAVEVPAAWLTRAASRICLNALDSAHHRRERYVGPWLPEPVPASAFPADVEATRDPLERVVLDDSVSQALLVVLEAMTGAERVSFVLHDVFAVPFDEIAEIVGRTPAACRQLATSARRRVRNSSRRLASQAEHDLVVRTFAAAARSGDLAALVAVLDPAAVLRSDGGGRVSAARRPVQGSDKVARFLLGALRARTSVDLSDQETADGLGFVLRDAGRVIGIVTIDVAGGHVTDVRLTMNPDKLSLWT